MKVRATVTLEFEGSNEQESVTVDDLNVIGSYMTSAQSRPIWEVIHPSVSGVYQHHILGCLEYPS